MNDLLNITRALEGFSSSEVGFIVTKAVRGETIKTQWSLDVQAYIKSAEEEKHKWENDTFLVLAERLDGQSTYCDGSGYRILLAEDQDDGFFHLIVQRNEEEEEKEEEE